MGSSGDEQRGAAMSSRTGWFHRSASQGPAGSGDAPDPGRCLDSSCGKRAASACTYHDRRGSICGTAWCREHRVMHSGKAFCRRHAGVIGALADWEYVEGLPDVDSRAPSLVSWVSHELDSRIRAVLSRVAPSASTKLVTDPVHQQFSPGNASRRWMT